MLTTKAVVPPNGRGCGDRKEGGVYLECGMGPGGSPVEDFLIDPPVVVDPGQGFPLPLQGMGLLQTPQGVWHLLDRVGLMHYPYPSDFVEEVRHFGLSRRVQKNLSTTVAGEAVNGFELLTPESRILLVHDRASLVNWQAFRIPHPEKDEASGWTCPKRRPEHHPSCAQECCAGLWWENHDRPKGNNPSLARGYVRKLPSLEYAARIRPYGVNPLYAGPAIFASFPISRIVVIRGDGAEQSQERVQGARLPVELEDF